MNDYINRQVAIKAAEQMAEEHQYDFVGLLISLPSEDVAPVRHGYWKTEAGRPAMVRDGYVIEEAYCSVCSGYLNGSDEYSVVGNYCPTCGARMQKGEET